MERVFEPFYRGEPSRNWKTGGMSLALPIARNFVRANAGDIVLANRSAGRAKVTMTLPV
jgi:signal transduction histidine kinase